MAHAVEKVTTSWSPAEALAYMADFSHTVEWDPGVIEAHRLDDGEIGKGSAFILTVRAAGRRLPMRYEITEFCADRVTFAARMATLASTDTVAVAALGGTTEVTYDARINFRGLLRLADPLLALAFRGVAKRAIRGLGERLGRPAVEAVEPH